MRQIIPLRSPPRSKVGAAATVDGNDLATDVGRIEHQEAHRARNVAGRTDALEQGVFDDALAFLGGELIVFRPLDGSGRDTVDPCFGCQFDRQRARQASQPCLGGAVKRVAGERPLGVDVDDVHDCAALTPDRGCKRL